MKRVSFNVEKNAIALEIFGCFNMWPQIYLLLCVSHKEEAMSKKGHKFISRKLYVKNREAACQQQMTKHGKSTKD